MLEKYDFKVLIMLGNRERTQEPTAANKTSSRSHALLMVNYKQTSKSKTSHSVKNGRYGKQIFFENEKLMGGVREPKRGGHPSFHTLYLISK